MSALRKFFAYLWATICGEKMPVWLALLLIIAGAIGTYKVAPKLNQGFQLQVAKREFMVDSMKDFASTTKSFIDGVSKLVNERNPTEETRVALIAKAAELNFFAVQLSYVIPEQSDLLLKFQENVVNVQETVAQESTNSLNGEIIAQLKVVSVQSLLIYQALAEKAGLGGK